VFYRLMQMLSDKKHRSTRGGLIHLPNVVVESEKALDRALEAALIAALSTAPIINTAAD
jgi:hypothetical protein